MFGMFTEAGNATVAAIVDDHLDRDYATPEAAFDAIVSDLEKLETIVMFSEATDTEVRELVYVAVVNHFKTRKVKS
jgi:hypothetical protein